MIVNQNEELLPDHPPRPSRLSTFRAVILGMVLGAVGFGSFTVRLPLVTLHPGPTPGVSELVKVEGHTTPALGAFHITTVCVGDGTTFSDVVGGWLSPKVAVISRSAIYPPGKTPEEVSREQIAQMEDSKKSAAVAAMRELGYTVEPESVTVQSTLEGSPAAEALQAGDVIVAVDGRPITLRKEVGETIQNRRVGEKVTVQVRRGEELKEFSLETVPASEREPRPTIGVALSQRYRLPVTIDVDSRNIGGPSAGLMFAIGIVDQIDPVDLTHGYTMAGTGTIDEEGKVGKVGGVGQKIAAADKVGAQYFFVPKEELAEAIDEAPSGIKVVGVSDLHEAVTKLKELADDRPAEDRPRPKGIREC